MDGRPGTQGGLASALLTQFASARIPKNQHIHGVDSFEDFHFVEDGLFSALSIGLIPWMHDR